MTEDTAYILLWILIFTAFGWMIGLASVRSSAAADVPNKRSRICAISCSAPQH